MEAFAPRLHVLLARDAPTGVVLRRGPSKQVCTIGWDRERDKFQVGQWLKGRIYERRSDLSPDGKYMIYFAMNGKWTFEARGSWTAISRAPYLKAISLFAKGDAWNGGGLFTGPKTYWLNGADYHTSLRDSGELRRQATTKLPEYEQGECLGVYYPRLMRDGWTRVVCREPGKWLFIDLFDKPAGAGWVLRKFAHRQIHAPAGKGCYWDQHQLLHPATGTEMTFPDWEWAEIDGKRLVWAEHGKLYAGTLGQEGLTTQTLLYDFSDMQFEAKEAPY
jgi:hypothetical protein